jgi:hypothetical protein
MIPDVRLVTWPGLTAPLSRATRSTCKLCTISNTFTFSSRSPFPLRASFSPIYWLIAQVFFVWLSYVMSGPSVWDCVGLARKRAIVKPRSKYYMVYWLSLSCHVAHRL